MRVKLMPDSAVYLYDYFSQLPREIRLILSASDASRIPKSQRRHAALQRWLAISRDVETTF